MKNLFSVIFALIAMTCIACGKRTAEPATVPPVCGGYSEYRDLSSEDVALFDSVYTQQPPLTPYAVATQVVAGLNYRFLCRDSAKTEYLVKIFVPLQSNSADSRPELTGVYVIE